MTASRTKNARPAFAIVFSIGLLSATAFTTASAQPVSPAVTAPVAVDQHGLDGASAPPGAAPPPSAASAPRPAARNARAGRRDASRPRPARAAGVGSRSNVVAEARRWIGTNPTGHSRLWCAHFMNFVLERTGHGGTGSGLARSFASYGTRVSGPKVGAIAVMSRGRRGGHVGVVSGISQSGDPIVISGNHGRRVAEAVYPRGRIFAYVVPEG